MQTFTEIKPFMRFIQNFTGRAKIKGSKVYFRNKLVAEFKKEL